MNKRKKPAEKPVGEKQRRFLEAKEDFKKMQEEIAPFIKRRKFEEYSTEGEWSETSSFYS